MWTGRAPFRGLSYWPWLQSVRPVCFSLVLGERTRGELCRFQAKQRQTLINRKEVPKHSSPKEGWGWGRGEAPRTRLYSQSILTSQAVSLQLPPAWNPRCLHQENGSDRMERSNYSSSGGCWGWVGSSSLGALGPQLVGPGSVAGGEGRGGRPGTGRGAQGLLTEGQCPVCLVGLWRVAPPPVACGRPAGQHPQGRLRQSASFALGMARG